MSCITSLVGSKRVQMRSTASNHASARCTAGSISTRGTSEMTATLTIVSIDTLENSCRVLSIVVMRSAGLGQRLRHGRAERLGAICGAAHDIDLGALALDNLRGQSSDVAQWVLQGRAGDRYRQDATALDLHADPHIAATTRARAGIRPVFE